MAIVQWKHGDYSHELLTVNCLTLTSVYIVAHSYLSRLFADFSASLRKHNTVFSAFLKSKV